MEWEIHFAMDVWDNWRLNLRRNKKAMALYLVVRHRLAEPSFKNNKWQDESDALLMSINTTQEIGEFCSEAQKQKQRVYIHRCGFPKLDIKPLICCSVSIAKVTIRNRQTEVQFEDQTQLNIKPRTPPPPVQHQNYYFAPPP
jgi:hypothetical protein